MFRVLLGQKLFGGTVCVHIQAEPHAPSEAAGTVPNGWAVGDPIGQEMESDLMQFERVMESGPVSWSASLFSDNGFGEFIRA